MAIRAYGSRHPPVTLVVGTFEEFGYDDLIRQYQRQTGLKIELRKASSFIEYRNDLVNGLASGKGLPDVVALEEGILTEFKTNPGQWADLHSYLGG